MFTLSINIEQNSFIFQIKPRCEDQVKHSLYNETSNQRFVSV